MIDDNNKGILCVYPLAWNPYWLQTGNLLLYLSFVSFMKRYFYQSRWFEEK